MLTPPSPMIKLCMHIWRRMHASVILNMIQESRRNEVGDARFHAVLWMMKDRDERDNGLVYPTALYLLSLLPPTLIF